VSGLTWRFFAAILTRMGSCGIVPAALHLLNI
jgi:hypothetical protein